MADEPPPPAGPPPDIIIRPVSKAERVAACRDMLDRGYSPAQVASWCATDQPDKTWKVSKFIANRYVNAALESLDGEVLSPKERKQARVRGMLNLAARRALALASDETMKGKAAGLINAAVAALDKIAKIDGSYAYDPATMLPPSVNPTTPEEAVRIVTHAHATMELAIRRGALVAAPPPKPVIDTKAVEVEEDDGEGAELDDGADAN